MARLTKKAADKRKKDLLKYKWEFVRRNKDYIKDYNNLCAMQKKVPAKDGFLLKSPEFTPDFATF